MDADVLIVGAGPTGLMLANQLQRHGVRVLIIERNAGPARETRALGVQARTLEIYAQLGLAERAIELGKRGTGATLWARGRRSARVPLGDAGRDLTAYPYILVLGQDDNEMLLGERLRANGVGIQWRTELQSLQQQHDHVETVVRDAAGVQRTWKVAWVAGCDGAHSVVRHQLNIGFPGAPYEHEFFVADVKCHGAMIRDEVNIYLWRRGFHLLFPMRGEHHWRIVGILPPEQRGQDAVTFDQIAPQVSREFGPEFKVESCEWFATYRIHHRRAERFRAARCFLLGDAAHIHSPVGAQGMNTGLQDAYNLGWKLALVIKGQAGESLLDSYDEERGAVARRLLETTDRAFQLVVADGLFAGLLRTQILARIASLLMRQPRIQRLALRTVSQIGIHYRGSALSKTEPGIPARAPQAGDRFPWMHLTLSGLAPVDLYARLQGIRFTLLLFGQEAPGIALDAQLIDLIVVPSCAENTRAAELAHIPQQAYFLLRPDGYIGLCGGFLGPETLLAYLKNTAHLR